LCGIVAIYASGLLNAPVLWKDIQFDPKAFKKIFDGRVNKDGVGKSSVEVFRERYKENAGIFTFASNVSKLPLPQYS